MTKASRLHVVGAAIVDEGRCLVAQRGPEMSLAGSWEFPGGKVEARESTRVALAREVLEELGLEIDVGPWIGRGESVVSGREIVLDVFYSGLVQGKLHLREHSQTRWIRSGEIEELPWAEADRPILPILKRVLDRGLSDRPLPSPIPIVSVDWSKQARKRAVYAATPDGRGWRIERSVPPGTGWSLDEILELAGDLARPFGGSALVAIDAVLGVPVGYGLRTGRTAFPEVMEWLDQQGGLNRSIRDSELWCPESPFFAVNPGEGGLGRYVERAGGRAALYRECDRVTGGNPVFATSGIPGSVGSGSAALWREVLSARRSGKQDFRLWPFEMELDDVPESRVIAVAESYPRACYAVALASRLPSKPLSVAKTKSMARRERLDELRRAPWLREHCVELGGLDWALETEDDFDALMQAAALVRMSSSGVPFSSYLADPVWEGGILGTGGLVVRDPTTSRPRPAGSREARARSQNRDPSPSGKHCPIEGCSMVFRLGRLGWDAHVGSASIHPNWEPSLASSQDRKRAFREQFSEWFEE